MSILSADLKSALRLWRDFEAGDVAAIGQVHDMFPADSPCFLCDQPAGAGLRLLTTEDPAAPRTKAILAPLCANCMEQPLQLRLNRLRKMIAAMFGVKRDAVRLVPQVALRRLG